MVRGTGKDPLRRPFLPFVIRLHDGEKFLAVFLPLALGEADKVCPSKPGSSIQLNMSTFD